MERIRDTLKAAGLRVWIDDTGLDPGDENWQVVIENAIRQSACVVCIMSPHTPGSSWVRNELVFARHLKKRVYPVHVAGDSDKVVMLNLAAAHMVDVRDASLYQSRMKHLVDVIRRNHLFDNALIVTSSLRRDTIDEIETKRRLIDEISPFKIPDHEIHRLLVTQGEPDVPRTHIILKEGMFTIGRENSSSFIVSDLRVSNKHCQFVYTEAGFFLRDLASTNGTYVNDELIIGRILRDSDLIRLGRIVLKYRTNR